MWDVWLIVTSLIPWTLELVLLTSMCLLFLLVIITCTVHILIMFQLVQHLSFKGIVTIPPCCYPLCVVHGTCTHNNSSLLLPTTCNPRHFIHGMSPTEHTHDILTLLLPTAWHPRDMCPLQVPTGCTYQFSTGHVDMSWPNAVGVSRGWHGHIPWMTILNCCYPQDMYMISTSYTHGI